MTQTVAVTKAITSLLDVEQALGVSRTTRDDFFAEWQATPPVLNETENATLNRLKSRYDYHRFRGPLAEGTVNLLMVSPLLELAGFYEPPYHIRAEEPVTLQVEVDEIILSGRIDFLVIHDRIWVVVIESKRSTTDLELAIPQALTYMGAAATQAASSERPLYGMVTTGGLFCFLKLQGQEYDISDVFSLLPRRNRLVDVLGILQTIGKVVASSA